jgi:hypothetical protein
MAACGSSDTSSLSGIGGRQGGGGEIILPDGGIEPGTAGGGAGGCASNETLCGQACTDTSTDTKNCGACGTICDGTCTTGRCLESLVPASGSAVSTALGVSGSNVYYFGANGLMSVPTSGGTPKMIGPNGVGALAVGPESVFYFAGTYVMSVPLAGGAPTTISNGSGQALTANAEGVCWTTSNGDVKSAPAAGFGTGDAGTEDGGDGGGAAPVDAGEPTTLATGQTFCDQVVANNTDVYWTTNGTLSSAGGFAPETGTVEGLAFATVTPATADAGADAGAEGGATPTISLASAQNYPSGLAIDSTNVYWAASGTTAKGFADGAILKAPLSGGGTAVTIASAQALPYGIAVDATNVYWANNANGGQTGAILTAPIAGGAAITLASGLSSPSRVAVDGTSVYWTSGDGSVKKVTPKK